MSAEQAGADPAFGKLSRLMQLYSWELRLVIGLQNESLNLYIDHQNPGLRIIPPAGTQAESTGCG